MFRKGCLAVCFLLWRLFDCSSTTAAAFSSSTSSRQQRGAVGSSRQQAGSSRQQQAAAVVRFGLEICGCVTKPCSLYLASSLATKLKSQFSSKVSVTLGPVGPWFQKRNRHFGSSFAVYFGPKLGRVEREQEREQRRQEQEQEPQNRNKNKKDKNKKNNNLVCASAFPLMCFTISSCSILMFHLNTSLRFCWLFFVPQVGQVCI